jgi:hypothetical protein
MIRGTGPGRGLPWWRYRPAFTLRFEPGIIQDPFMIGRPREGRTVARIGAS